MRIVDRIRQKPIHVSALLVLREILEKYGASTVHGERYELWRILRLACSIERNSGCPNLSTIDHHDSQGSSSVPLGGESKKRRPWLLECAPGSLVFPAAGAGYSRLIIPAGVEVIELSSEGKARIAVATPRSKPRGVIIHFVGNGEDLSSGVHWVKAFTDFGLVSLVPEYPGYGQSEGSPGVESFFCDGRACG